ncbi:MAG TPA: HlyD family secretion protein [Candidatus Mailhella merdigallinarum]|uniref:HlyD family secretion protein n=1 Tax=Candidatus Mailhella merdigallinarum TaxID=2838658 RepID=A0A9D2HD88_9BACT|nr:HlyD family secretion protein [Desulfovibrionaceae bacterium]HJA08036.1 HlyD family secretion protein [Candidatus Mailhella merdigallinarum]
MNLKKVFAWGLTLAVAAVAVWLGCDAYRRHLSAPWTRDGQVQADVVLVAPRVSGPVLHVAVVDNQAVKAGDLLFTLDPSTYQAALREAEAALDVARAREAEQAAVTDRLNALERIERQAVTAENRQKAQAALAGARAARQQAEAEVETARLRLGFTEVRASVDGYVTNVSLQPGAQAVADTPLFALIDAASFRVTGFFRETLIRRIAVGSRAEVTLMAYPDRPLSGVVESLDWGISRSNGTPGEDLLPDVQPTFDWIRLAQRVPVNIRLSDVPDDVILRVGLTASVQVRP